MNDKRRERLKDALGLLSSASVLVEAVCDEEQDCLDNYPENLQGTERFERMEAAVDDLAEAMEKIDDAKDRVQAAIK